MGTAESAVIRAAAGRRCGFTLLELLLGLAGAAAITTALVGLLVTQLRVARAVNRQVADAAAVRTVDAVLRGELGHTYAVDLRGSSRDSLAMRFFRAAGPVCATDGMDLHTRLLGDRAPDATKDSVLVIREDGSEVTALLVAAARTSACTTSAPGENWRLRITPSARGMWVMVYESGGYHLTSGALRYRIGREGRQPLTDERFRSVTTRFSRSAGGISAALSLFSGPHHSIAAPSAEQRWP